MRLPALASAAEKFNKQVSIWVYTKRPYRQNLQLGKLQCKRLTCALPNRLASSIADLLHLQPRAVQGTAKESQPSFTFCDASISHSKHLSFPRKTRLSERSSQICKIQGWKGWRAVRRTIYRISEVRICSLPEMTESLPKSIHRITKSSVLNHAKQNTALKSQMKKSQSQS